MLGSSSKTSGEGAHTMPFVKSLRFGLSAIVPLMFLALFALSAPAAADTDFTKVRMVDYGTGAFVQTGPGLWSVVDKASGQANFKYQVLTQDRQKIVLSDLNRAVDILIIGNQIQYAEDRGEMRPLYQIVATSTKSRIPGSNVSWDGSVDAPKNLAVDGQPAAQSFDGYAWTYQRTRSSLGFALAKGALGFAGSGVTEVALLCLVKSDGSNSVLGTFGADVGGLTPGKSVAVEFTGDGFYTKLAAKVAGPQNSVPAGFAFNADIGDPLWSAMQGRRSLTYKVVGRAATKLPLTAGSSDVAEFVQECTAAKFD